MRSIALALLFLLLAGLRTAAPHAPAPGATRTQSAKILIVYLSRTGNTRAVAEMIRTAVGGKLVALDLQKPYPADYRRTVQQVVEENESGYLPPLKTRISDMKNYDVVFVGFPTWGMQLPPPVKSFLKAYDLSGKTVVPFNTNAGHGEGSSFATVKKLCENSRVAEGFVARGGIEKEGKLLMIKNKRAVEVEGEVRSWLQEIGISR